MSKATEPSNDWIAGGGFRTLALTAVTIGGLYLCALLVWPFAAPIAWALALAVLFAPLHRFLLKHLKRPNLAAAVSGVGVRGYGADYQVGPYQQRG